MELQAERIKFHLIEQNEGLVIIEVDNKKVLSFHLTSDDRIFIHIPYGDFNIKEASLSGVDILLWLERRREM